MFSLLMGVILGGIITIIVALWVEYLKTPKLEILLPNPEFVVLQTVDLNTNQLIQTPITSLRLRVRGKPLSRSLKWMMRSFAPRCYARIAFHQIDTGEKIFEMHGRWASLSQPTQPWGQIGGQPIQFFDLERLNFGKHADIYPDEYEELDVAAKFGSEPDCYGWNNENYYSTPQFRKPEWRMPRGRYFVWVTIKAGGQIYSEMFRLHNEGSPAEFRLELADKQLAKTLLS